MTFLRIIKDKSTLDGTAYVELLPGRYGGNCWNDGSVFFDEPTFGFFEKIIQKHVPEYDHYAFTEIAHGKWSAVSLRLKSFAAELSGVSSFRELPDDINFIFLDTEGEFVKDFPSNARLLAGVARELARWIDGTLKEHDAITVLGL
jgi:hypothetical protein